MRIDLERTDRLENARGCVCRVWEGVDDHGVPVLAWVALVSPQTNDPEVTARFEADLLLVADALPPRAIDTRLIF
jgi:hypothetical protein